MASDKRYDYDTAKSAWWWHGGSGRHAVGECGRGRRGALAPRGVVAPHNGHITPHARCASGMGMALVGTAELADSLGASVPLALGGRWWCCICHLPSDLFCGHPAYWRGGSGDAQPV